MRRVFYPAIFHGKKSIPALKDQIRVSRSAIAKPAMTPVFMAGKPGAGLLFMKNMR